MRKLIIAFLLITSVACSKQGDKVTSDIFLKGKELARIDNKKLGELSGIAPSRNNAGLFWVHNDSGNKDEIYLVDHHMNVKLTCKLHNAKNRDWEDIAVGPGPEQGKNYIYIGDIGDNMKVFQFKRIYRFEEPTLGTESEVTINGIEKIVFQLEGDRKDSEAFLLNPLTKDIYIVSKEKSPCFLYELKFPQSTSDTLVARKVLPLSVGIVCSAAFSQDGREVLMKNYENVYYWKVGSDSLSLALRARPEVVQYKKDPQGEGICFAPKGSGYYTVSEIVRGEKSYLKFYPRKKRK